MGLIRENSGGSEYGLTLTKVLSVLSGYAVMRAAQIAVCKPDVLCARTVVDLADGDKNDRLHPYGCEISGIVKVTMPLVSK